MDRPGGCGADRLVGILRSFFQCRDRGRNLLPKLPSASAAAMRVSGSDSLKPTISTGTAAWALTAELGCILTSAQALMQARA